MNAQLVEAIKAETKRCVEDYIYAIKKYFKVEHPKKGKILFSLFPFQEETLLALIKHRFVVIGKSRQMGISTLMAAYALMNMILRPNYKILVIATTQDVASNLVRKVRIMFENLPTFLKKLALNGEKALSVANKLSMELPNGSSIKAVSSSASSGRSEALSLLIIDEAAFVDRFEEIWTSAQMTLATGGDAVILSTPNGTGNLFCKIFTQAENGEQVDGMSEKDRFFPIRLPWHLHPERDQAWRDLQTALLGKRDAAQECDVSFLTSGATVIEPETIAWYETEMVKEPIQKRGPGDDIWIWEFPDYTKSYMLVADVARGDSSDNNSFHILDIVTLEQVAEYKGKMDTTTFGRVCVAMATEYNSALLVIENTGVGWAVVQIAIDLNYQNLHYSYKNDPFLDENIHLAKNFDLKEKKDMVPGFTTSHIVRPMLVSKLDMYFRERSPKIRSSRTAAEMRVFVWKNGRGEAEKGHNDDLMMPLAIALFLRDTAIKLRQIGIELTKRTLNNTHKTVFKPNRSNSDPWLMNNARGGKTDLRWLL